MRQAGTIGTTRHSLCGRMLSVKENLFSYSSPPGVRQGSSLLMPIEGGMHALPGYAQLRRDLPHALASLVSGEDGTLLGRRASLAPACGGPRVQPQSFV